jgi:hypothetical protein
MNDLQEYLEGVKDRQIAKELKAAEPTVEFATQTANLPEPLRPYHKYTGYDYTRLELPNCDPIRLNWRNGNQEVASCEVERLDYQTEKVHFETYYDLESAIFAAQDSTLAESFMYYSNEKLLEISELSIGKSDYELSTSASLLVIARVMARGGK